MKLNNTGKRVLRPFITPQHFDFWSRELGSTMAWQRVMARVVERRQETASTVTLRLQPNGNFSGFVAGQHVNVTAEIRGRRVTRSYSISNCADGSAAVEITVRREPAGQMSNWLHEHAQPGEILELGQAFGSLSLSATDADIALLAAGSGITPMMSLIRDQAAKGMTQSVTLLYWDRGADAFCFGEELDRIAAQYPLFTVHRIATGNTASAQSQRGRISTAQLTKLLPGMKSSAVLACGGAEFVASAERLCAGTAERFDSEYFSPPPQAASDEAAAMVTVELARSGRQLQVSNQDNLLVALEAQGVSVPSGCRIGICNTCSCLKQSGSSVNVQSGVAEHAPGAPLRLCVNRATTDLKLDL